MTKAKKLESRGNVFTPFTGCAQIYHPSGGMCALRGLLQRALPALGQATGELHSPTSIRPTPSELCVWIKAKMQPLSGHKVCPCTPLLYRQNVGASYG